MSSCKREVHLETQKTSDNE